MREDDAELQALRDDAKAKGRGMWNPNTKNAVPRVNYRESQRGEVSADLFDFFEKMKNKALQGTPPPPPFPVQWFVAKVTCLSVHCSIWWRWLLSASPYTQCESNCGDEGG